MLTIEVGCNIGGGGGGGADSWWALYGTSLPGVLACLDGYMNIALEQTEEYVNGQVRTSFITAAWSLWVVIMNDF